MASNARNAETRERYLGLRRRAMREDWIARLRGKPNDLLPYEAVAGILKAYEHLQLTEHRLIALDRIVGSVGRYRSFTRSFLPRGGVSFDRWSGIEAAMTGASGVPPIEVYQIGEVYFVADGNHRVAVARANGFTEIDAYVTLVPGDPGLQPGDSLDQAIIKVECLHFLAQTRLAEECAALDISFTKPGGYPHLLEHIYAHRYFKTLESNPEEPEAVRMSFPAAARDWYDSVYLPIVAVIRRQGLPRRFPHTTAADLYVWIASRLVQMQDLTAQHVTPDQAVMLLTHEAPTPFYQTVLNAVNRLARMVNQPDAR